jgi:hypothetical protein
MITSPLIEDESETAIGLRLSKNCTGSNVAVIFWPVNNKFHCTQMIDIKSHFHSNRNLVCLRAIRQDHQGIILIVLSHQPCHMAIRVRKCREVVHFFPPLGGV